MKICRILLVLSAVLFSSSVFAMRPPEYLSVPGWQSCTATEPHKGYQSVCLPRHRPHGCPRESWHQLKYHSSLRYCRR